MIFKRNTNITVYYITNKGGKTKSYEFTPIKGKRRVYYLNTEVGEIKVEVEP